MDYYKKSTDAQKPAWNRAKFSYRGSKYTLHRRAKYLSILAPKAMKIIATHTNLCKSFKFMNQDQQC